MCRKCAARIRKCPVCGTRFETDIPSVFCCSITCLRRHKAEEWWDQLPSVYRKTKLERLPAIAAAKRVLDWDAWGDGSLRGLFAWGPTGCGKTRTAVLKLRQLIETDAGGVAYFRAAEFAREIVERTKPGGKGGFAEWIESMREVEVLCIDEVEKLKLSERVGVEFFDLAEVRLSSDELVTMFFGNAAPDALAARMSEEFGPAFLRRITEFCLPVPFNTKSRKR